MSTGPSPVLLDPVLLDRVRRRVATEGSPPTAARVAAALREEGGALLGDAELLGVLRVLQSEIAGAGPLEPVGSSRVDLQACKLEYSIVSPK